MLTSPEAIARLLRVPFADPLDLARSLAFEVWRRDLGDLLAVFVPIAPPAAPILVLDDRALFPELAGAVAVAAAHHALGHRSCVAYRYTAAGPRDVPWQEAEEARRFVAAFLMPS